MLVITAGLGTNELLELIHGCPVRFPLSPDRPVQSKYFIPDPAVRDQYTEETLPVFAYLDVGIYGHPIYAGKTPGVKIGFYHPPDATVVPSSIKLGGGLRGRVHARAARRRDGRRRRGQRRRHLLLRPGRGRRLHPRPAAGRRRRLRRRSAGAAPATSSRRGWAGCWPSSRSSRGTVYDISRFTPGRFAPGRSGSDRRSDRRDSRMTAGQGIEQRLAQGVVLGAEGYVFELERRGYIKAGPVRARGRARLPRRGARAAPGVPAGRGGGHGRADLLRAPGEAAARRPRERPGGDEPARRPAGPGGRPRGRRAGGGQRLQHLGLRSRPTRRPARPCGRSTPSSSAGRSTRASTS